MRPMPHKLLCLALAALPLAVLPLSADAAAAADRPDRNLCWWNTSGFASMQGKEVKDGYVDKDGQWAIPPVFTNRRYGYLRAYWTAGQPTDGQFYTTRIGERYQIIRRDGLPLRLERYNSANQFYDNRILVKYDDRVEYLDLSGNPAFEADLGYGFDFKSGLAMVASMGPEGMIHQRLIDTNGNTLFALEPSNVLISLDTDSLAAVGLGPFLSLSLHGYMDMTGKYVVPPKYDSAEKFKEGLSVVSLGGQFGYVDVIGAVAIPLQFDYADSFSEGLALVKKDGKFGYINAKGDLVIPFEFDAAESFSEGLAAVKVNDQWGFIDQSGAWVIPTRYETGDTFEDGIALVTIEGRGLLIDKTGMDILAEKHGYSAPETRIYRCKTGLYTVSAPGHPGYVADVREGRLTPIQDPTEAMHGFNLLLAALYSENPAEMLAFANSLADQDQDAWAKTFYQSIVLNFPGTKYAEEAAEQLD